MGEIGVVAHIVLSRTEVLATLLLGTLVLGAATVVLTRRAGWSWWRTVWAGLAAAGLAVVPAVTLARGQVRLGDGQVCLLDRGLSLTSPEAVLNAALLVPAAFFAVLALRRVVPVVAGAAALTVAVEVLQLVTGAGTCQIADMVRNLGGALVAAGGAALLIRLATARGSDPTAATRIPADEVRAGR